MGFQSLKYKFAKAVISSSREMEAVTPDLSLFLFTQPEVRDTLLQIQQKHFLLIFTCPIPVIGLVGFREKSIFNILQAIIDLLPSINIPLFLLRKDSEL